MIPNAMRQRIDEKLDRIRSNRPLSPGLVKKLRQAFALEMTYNSNAIEGNRLTLKETMLVINEGITVKGKSLRDHMEAKNHFEAIEYLYELVERPKKNILNQNLIRSLHKLVMQDVDRDCAGAYRKGSVIITGSKHNPPEAYEVPQLMQSFLDELKSSKNKKHPVELAAWAHHRLAFIHPFDDGNGRTARIFMNLILMGAGYPLVVILKNDRKKYYRALELADRGKIESIEKFIAQAVERSMNIYLKAIGSGRGQKEKILKLSDLAKICGFSEKYLNLLARSGRLDAHKQGRLWMSSEGAVQDYLEGRLRKRKRG